jgi:hypothetical protein
VKIVWEGCRATVGRRLARRLFRVQGTQKTALMPLAEKKAQQEPHKARLERSPLLRGWEVPALGGRGLPYSNAA